MKPHGDRPPGPDAAGPGSAGEPGTPGIVSAPRASGLPVPSTTAPGSLPVPGSPPLEPPADDLGGCPRPRVLLIEDDADMRAHLRKHLGRDYEILEAERGDDGLRATRQEIPDLVVSDILMPGMDGYALCRALKSDPETDYIPVILLTSKSDLGSRMEGLEGGADDYIGKPFHPRELLLRIRNLLLARRRLRARYAPRPGSQPLDPTPLPVPSGNDAFSRSIRKLLECESQNEGFDVLALAEKLGISRTHLHRRVKQVFHRTPSELLVEFRLERAARMLVQHTGNVGEIAYAVGFRDLSHFVKRFRLQYSQTPAAFAAAQRQQCGLNRGPSTKP